MCDLGVVLVALRWMRRVGERMRTYSLSVPLPIFATVRSRSARCAGYGEKSRRGKVFEARKLELKLRVQTAFGAKE